MRKIFLLLLISSNAFAQKAEIGVFGGITNYLGDLSPVAFAPSETRWAAGLVYKYNSDWHFTVRSALTYGLISGSDARNNAGQSFRIRRNLSFRTSIIEASLIGEYNLWGWQGESYTRTFTPYLEGGFAIFHFNPQAYYNGAWVDLQPLGTEGQGLPSNKGLTTYRLTQLAIPLGIGVKVRLGEHWCVAADCAMRKTFTDYLDDVSTYFPNRSEMLANKGQVALDLSDRSFEVATDSTKLHFANGQVRGDLKNKDWYFFPGITITYKLNVYKQENRLNPDSCPTLKN
ncbi:MAG: hypothetical protein D4R43_01975 [Sphingobacteriales bacterium]|nr:MAG: hypothetical protein D4R43_01975 [Sphingobacteriales bacterium]